MPLSWVIVLLLLKYTVNLIKIAIKEKKDLLKDNCITVNRLAWETTKKNCGKHWLEKKINVFVLKEDRQIEKCKYF